MVSHLLFLLCTQPRAAGTRAGSARGPRPPRFLPDFGLPAKGAVARQAAGRRDARAAAMNLQSSRGTRGEKISLSRTLSRSFSRRSRRRRRKGKEGTRGRKCVRCVIALLRKRPLAIIGNPAFASTNKLLDENLIFCIENTANCRQSKAKNKLV